MIPILGPQRHQLAPYVIKEPAFVGTPPHVRGETVRVSPGKFRYVDRIEMDVYRLEGAVEILTASGIAVVAGELRYTITEQDAGADDLRFYVRAVRYPGTSRQTALTFGLDLGTVIDVPTDPGGFPAPIALADVDLTFVDPQPDGALLQVSIPEAIFAAAMGSLTPGDYTLRPFVALSPANPTTTSDQTLPLSGGFYTGTSALPRVPPNTAVKFALYWERSDGAFSGFFAETNELYEADEYWPPFIPANLWDSGEVRDAAPAGRRWVLVDESVEVPEGFVIKYYSGPQNLGLPIAGGATLTPGVTYTTNSSLPIPSTAFDSLGWQRLSDGLIRRAHPDEEQNVISMQGLTTEPTPPVGPNPNFPPDVLASSEALIRSLIQSKIAAGFTGDEDYVIGFTQSLTGLNLRDLNNHHMSEAGNRIYVRAVGTYDDIDGCSVKINGGRLSFQRSRGIMVALSDIRGATWDQVSEGSDWCGVTYCRVQGANNTDTPISNALFYGFTIRECSNFEVSHCVVRGSHQANLLFWTVTGARIFGNMLDYPQYDEHKVFWQFDNGIFDRNWSAQRRIPKEVGTSPHYDYWQNQGAYERFNSMWGNFIAPPEGPLGYQGIFHKRENNGSGTGVHLEGTVIENNIGNTSLGLVWGFAASAAASIRYNMALTAGVPGNNLGAIIAGLGPLDYNFATVHGGADPAAAAGPNGIGLRVGHSTRNPDGTYSNFRYNDELANYFEYGIPWYNADGTNKPLSQKTLKAYMPKVTGGYSRLHWLHPNPCGPFKRLREIFDSDYRATASEEAGYNVMPHKWPVLGLWHNTLNTDNYVPSPYTGSYDENGNPV